MANILVYHMSLFKMLYKVIGEDITPCGSPGPTSLGGGVLLTFGSSRDVDEDHRPWLELFGTAFCAIFMCGHVDQFWEACAFLFVLLFSVFS